MMKTKRTPFRPSAKKEGSGNSPEIGDDRSLGRRGRGAPVTEVEPVFPPADPLELGVSCRFNDPAFWSRYQRVKDADGVFLFWGHSYELINEAMWADLENKIAGISADPAAEWMDLEALFATKAY